MNHGARPEMTLKKPYTFKKPNKQQPQHGKKALYPTAILFAGVKRLDLQSQPGSAWERLAAAPAAVSSCQSCSSKTRCFLRVQQDSVSYSIFLHLLWKAWNEMES